LKRDFSRGAASPSGAGGGVFPAPNTPRPPERSGGAAADGAATSADVAAAVPGLVPGLVPLTVTFVIPGIGLGAGIPPLIPVAARFRLERGALFGSTYAPRENPSPFCFPCAPPPPNPKV